MTAQVELLRKIERAFSWRRCPLLLADETAQLSTDEREEVEEFFGLSPMSLTGDLLEENFEAIFWFSPTAFQYFLPGIYCAGIREARPELIVNQTILNMLSASVPTEGDFDPFFKARWVGLRAEEYEASQEWMLWLSQTEDPGLCARAFANLEYLKLS
jgi:hypothetical protein